MPRLFKVLLRNDYILILAPSAIDAIEAARRLRPGEGPYAVRSA